MKTNSCHSTPDIVVAFRTRDDVELIKMKIPPRECFDHKPTLAVDAHILLFHFESA